MRHIFKASPIRRLEEQHLKRVKARELRVRGPIYRSIAEIRKAGDGPVHHPITAMENKQFVQIPRNVQQ